MRLLSSKEHFYLLTWEFLHLRYNEKEYGRKKKNQEKKKKKKKARLGELLAPHSQHTCAATRADVRNNALTILQRALLSPYLGILTPQVK